MKQEKSETEKVEIAKKALPEGGDFVDNNTYKLPNPMGFDGKPLMVDGKVVEVLTLHKKRPTELMGIDIGSLDAGNVDTTVEMLQRSCTPSLSIEDVNNLDLPVILIATATFKTFFMGTQSPMSAS